MHNIVIDKPYEFVRPDYGTFWPRLLGRIVLPQYLRLALDGTIFIARNAAKQRAAQSRGKVVLHPVAIRYFFLGNIELTLEPVLEDIERRLSWRPQSDKTMEDRIVKVGEALLTLKERSTKRSRRKEPSLGAWRGSSITSLPRWSRSGSKGNAMAIFSDA